MNPVWKNLYLFLQITEMGFDVHAARNALLKLKGDIQKAVQELAKHGGHLPSTSSLAAMSSTRPGSPSC